MTSTETGERIVKAQDDKLTSILISLTNQIPKTLIGKERQEFIGNLVEKQPDQTKLFLQEVLNVFLRKMRSFEASDIELGGVGCEGHTWYRVFGDKKPNSNSRIWTLEESDILLQNILMKSQKEYLYQNRYVDFSYQTRSNSERLRFRATIYFEMNHLGLNMRLIDPKVRPLKNLGFHPKVENALSLRHVKSGLVLVTGITGSGKRHLLTI